jgi:ABC-type bacteriocin/lantibiotic exporter with double-glycine peptidase domain
VIDACCLRGDIEQYVACSKHTATTRTHTHTHTHTHTQPFPLHVLARYDEVIDACCLRSDIEQFVDGERTEIGEKGINLSGGQKARIALARAVYSRAPLVLLDDPLSAVDPHVARALYENVVQGLLKDRTVVLVTHHPHFMRDGSTVIVLGKVRRTIIVTFVDYLAAQVCQSVSLSI